MGLQVRKPVFGGFANKGADLPVHQRSLNLAFVIPLLISTISRLAKSEILNFYLVSVAKQAGLNLTLSETPKTGILASRPISRVGISGTTAKSHKNKFVPSSHPGPFEVVASSWKRQTKVGTLAYFDFL